MSVRKVPFFNYPYIITQNEDEVRARMEDVFKRGAFIMQKDLVEFEENLKKYLGVKYAFGVANGTDAIVIALKAAGIQPGDEVILPSHTFIASAAAVALNNAVPVPVECAPDHMLDPEVIEKAITKKTKFIMPVQVNGRTCDMDRIQAIADRHGLKIVEDAAQGLGSKWKGKMASTFGIAGTFSFFPAKVLGCWGDGGAIVTNDDQMAKEIYALRDHGRNQDGEIVTWGFNSRLDNLHAAVLDVKLKHYPQVIARRREIAKMYQKGLGDMPQLVLPPAPDSDPNHFDVYQNYELEADKRDQLRSFLSDQGVGTLIQWGGKAIHHFDKLGMNKYSLPKTDRYFTRFLMLPMNMAINNEDVAFVIESVREFYKKH
ncbi:MAG: DegT/DnrJ/EryC1/StrS family aminotransferase [Bdellovibrionales bacterium]